MVHKVSTHCVACLASSVGGGGQVREGGWLTRVRQLAGIWYPGSQALGLVALSLGPGEGGGGQGGTGRNAAPASCRLDPVTPLPVGQRSRRWELECVDFLNPGPLECVSNTSHGAL